MSLEKNKDTSQSALGGGTSFGGSEYKGAFGVGGAWRKKSSAMISGMRVGSLFKNWAEVSKINFLPTTTSTGQTICQSRNQSIVKNEEELRPGCLPFKTVDEELFVEQFPANVTPLMNESQLWGCFYIFPELYQDVFSPVVPIRNLADVSEIVGGVLTRDLVTACLTYLRRTPILGDFVYIKLDLSSKHLMNIDVLQHYKYLVYLDLSSNYLTELSVLSHLLYLQFLSVDFNRLNTVLEYDTPQWFLTEVHYKYNSVKKIRNIAMFWAITILDLSHNNIKGISGLESLRYLRHLDLSFNHIQRLENLNYLRLLWLDVSYNNISIFEFGNTAGLWTLMHLEYLNLNENNLVSMKVFSGCTRLRELHARNNRLSTLLEMAVYMRQLRRLMILDLRANPICSTPGYKDVVINTFPVLITLDAEKLDPVEQRTLKLTMTPDIKVFAVRRLLRLLYIEQLSRATVSRHVPPADTTEVPMVILVGTEAVGKGKLARRLAKECSDHVELALQHTTAVGHQADHYKEISRERFDDMLLAGEFLTYSEMEGESYGLSREESEIHGGKVKIATMELLPALMMKYRGRRPYLILTSLTDKNAQVQHQRERKDARIRIRETRLSMEVPIEKSTLQVLISGRILVTGILNEILLGFPDEKEESEFVIESQCSLLMDSEARQAVEDFARGFNMLALITSSASSLEEVCDHAYNKTFGNDSSLQSLYKESQNTDEYASEVTGHESCQGSKKSGEKIKQDKISNISRPKSVDFSRYVSSTWKGLSGVNSTKSSKSVTFTSEDRPNESQGKGAQELVRSGMLIDPPVAPSAIEPLQQKLQSISTKLPWPTVVHMHGPPRTGSVNAISSADDLDLWLAFLMETGLLRASDADMDTFGDPSVVRPDTAKIDDPDFIINQLNYYDKSIDLTDTTSVRDEYENIHRNYPGVFWDTVRGTLAKHLLDPRKVNMDNPDAAFTKMKSILRGIVNSQSKLKPMFDVDFANLDHYPNVKTRLERIRQQIAPQRLFF